MEHFKLCCRRGRALPSESCLHISWPERLVSRELIQMMKTMRSLRRCWSRLRALRSELQTQTHLKCHPNVCVYFFTSISLRQLVIFSDEGSPDSEMEYLSLVPY